MIPVVVGLGLIVVFLALGFVARSRIASARRSGILPEAGQATMADVERLASTGQRIWAIRCYREIHACGLAEAKRAVKNLRPVA